MNETDQIEKVNAKSKDKEGTYEKQFLILVWKQLKNSNIVTHYSIQNNSTLYLVLGLRGEWNFDQIYILNLYNSSFQI